MAKACCANEDDSKQCPVANGTANELKIALVGNPNAGKTTFFNKLTGSHQSTGN